MVLGGGTAAAVDLLHLPSKKRLGLAQSWQDSTRHRGAPPAVAQPSCTMPWRRHTAEPAIRTSSAEGVMRERPRRRSSTGTALTSVQSLSMLPSWLREAPEPSTAPVGRPLLTRSCGGTRCPLLSSCRQKQMTWDMLTSLYHRRPSSDIRRISDEGRTALI